MTQTEITLRIRDNIILIMDLANAWEGNPGSTWQEKIDTTTGIMKDKTKCSQLINKLNSIADAGTVKDTLSEEFVRGTARLLQYRIDADDMSVSQPTRKKRKTHDGKTLSDDQGTGSSWDKHLEFITRSLKLSGQTVIGYRMVQELGNGDPDKILAIIQDKFKDSEDTYTFNIEMIPMEILDMREKMTYMDHRIWMIEPSLPVYLVTAEKSSHGCPHILQ